MQRGTWLLIALIYLAFAEFVSWAPVPDLSLCLLQAQDDPQSADQDAPKYCAAFHTGVQVFFEQTNHFLETHDKGVVGAFTIVLAISTIGLWMATNRLWEAGENQLRHLSETASVQLRAYVYVEKTDLTFKDNVWNHSFRIKNVGRTPAHNVKLMSITQVVDWNGGYPTVPVPTEDEVENLGSMGPNGDYFDNDKEIYESVTVDQLNDEKKVVYLVGNIRYTTVFDSLERITNFRFYVGGDIQYEGGEMSADDEGNDAT
jgi:hypothetical protein